MAGDAWTAQEQRRDGIGSTNRPPECGRTYAPFVGLTCGCFPSCTTVPGTPGVGSRTVSRTQSGLPWWQEQGPEVSYWAWEATALGD